MSKNLNFSTRDLKQVTIIHWNVNYHPYMRGSIQEDLAARFSLGIDDINVHVMCSLPPPQHSIRYAVRVAAAPCALATVSTDEWSDDQCFFFFPGPCLCAFNRQERLATICP